ncbi:MAG: hypothetical protein K2J04_11890 [Lachnospiraceae bacterium]|nr:hypothetical protein [Lachnospiraceae bacterium]
MKKSIFNIMEEYSINEGLDNISLQDEEYIKIQDKIAAQREEFDRLNLTKEQCLIVDRLLSAHTESGAVYGKLAYRKGFQDCAALLLEMKLIKAA